MLRRKAVQIAEIEIQIRYVVEYLNRRLCVGYGLRIVVIRAHMFLHARPGVAGVVHCEHLDVALHRGDEVYHLGPQHRTVHQVEGLVEVVIRVRRGVRLPYGRIQRTQGHIVFLRIGLRNGTQERSPAALLRINHRIQGRQLRGAEFALASCDFHLHRRRSRETVEQRILVAACKHLAVNDFFAGHDISVHRPQTYIYIPVLQHFVVEVLAREFGVERDQRTVLARRIRERALVRDVAGPVFLNLALGSAIVLLRRLIQSEAALDVGAIHIGLGEVRIEFDGPVVVLQRVLPAFHFNEYGGAVEIGQDVFRIDVQHPVHIGKRGFVLPYLRVDKSPVVECERVARLVFEHPVQVVHRAAVFLLFGKQQGAVEIGERIRAVQFYRMVEVGYGGFVVALFGIETSAPYISLRIETVQFYCLVVVAECLRGVGEEKVASAAVQVGRRVFRLFAYIFVEVAHCIFELPGKEVGDAAAVIESGEARPEVNCPLQVA